MSKGRAVGVRNAAASGARVAVLGNSHAAALKNALDDGVGSSGVDITIYARPNGRGGLDGLEVQGSRLVAGDEVLSQWFKRTAGHAELDTADYTHIWIYGFGPESKSLQGLLRELGRHGARFSRAVMAATIQDYAKALEASYRGSPLYELAEKVRAATDKPVYVSPKPFYSESLAPAPLSGMEGELADELRSVHRQAIRALFETVDAGLLTQPADTVAHGCFSVERYATADGKHMNAAFGKRMIEVLVDAIGPGPGQG